MSGRSDDLDKTIDKHTVSDYHAAAHQIRAVLKQL